MSIQNPDHCIRFQRKDIMIPDVSEEALFKQFLELLEGAGWTEEKMFSLYQQPFTAQGQIHKDAFINKKMSVQLFCLMVGYLDIHILNEPQRLLGRTHADELSKLND